MNQIWKTAVCTDMNGKAGSGKVFQEISHIGDEQRLTAKNIQFHDSRVHESVSKKESLSPAHVLQWVDGGKALIETKSALLVASQGRIQLNERGIFHP